jgi:enediyne biosynthesis protein E4
LAIGRKLLCWVAVGAAGAGLLWASARFWQDHRFQRSLAKVQDEIDAGRFATARRDLLPLLEWRPDSDQAVYLMGVCERNGGRVDSAAEWWSRVPFGSAFCSQAIQGRMELEIERGRLEEAERIVEEAAADPRVDASGVRLYLGPIYSQEGRTEEARRIVEARWEHLLELGEGAQEPAINLIRLFIALRLNLPSVEVTRAFLDQMATLAPQDDRVWLGKANLAIRTGALDEAARWIDACLKQRPDDAPVWQARLAWALAAHRVDQMFAASAHIPASQANPARVHQIVAWLAARRGDVDGERAALHQLIADAPADLAAIGRLVEIESLAGRTDSVAGLRARQAEIQRLHARYQRLYQRNQPSRDAAEMASLAERLGERFEARAFLTLAVNVDPDRSDLPRDLARLNPSRGQVFSHGTLADLLRSLPGVTESNRR